MQRRFCLTVILSATLLAACGGGDSASGPPKSKAFPVQVEKIAGRQVEYVVSAVGSVEAFEEVLVTARVSGVVEQVLFREGQKVTTSDVLVEIEPRRFQYAADAAASALDQALAEVTEIETGLNSRKSANEKARKAEKIEPFSVNEIQAWESRFVAAQANAATRKAQADQAALDLEFARLRSPLAGVIQSRQVSTGQWVTPGTVIARLQRRDPMLLRFAVAEDRATQLKPGLEATFTLMGARREYKARLTHVAASADQATRMVAVIAEVAPADSAELTPGSFMRVRVPVGSRADAPTVPETAIRPSEKGFLVYVVKDGKAEQRVIEIGLRTDDGRVEVTAGLKIGEEVVVRGAEALREGVEVTTGGKQGGGGKP